MASPVENGEASKTIQLIDLPAGAITADMDGIPSATTHNYVTTDNNIVLDKDRKSPNQWQMTRHDAMKAAVPTAVWNTIFLPCITYGKTQHDLQHIKTVRENPEGEFAPYKKVNGPCVGYGMLTVIPPLAGILAVKETNRIRGEYDIEPRKNNNAKSIFCPHCTILRDQLEVVQRENERGAGVVAQQPPASPPMQEISPRPDATSPPLDAIPDKMKKPKKKGKAADIIEQASKLLKPSEVFQRHPDTLSHLKRPLSRILERRSETTQDTHVTGSSVEAIEMPPLPTLGVDVTQEDEELPSRLPTPLPHGLHEEESAPEEPLPQPPLSPFMMPMDEIIVRIRTPSPSPSPSRSRERVLPPARANSPVQGFHPYNLSPLRSRSPASGRIGPALLPHEIHTGAANALSVDDPLTRKAYHRGRSPHNDWMQDSEVTTGPGPGPRNLEIDITLPTLVTPLAHHVREDQALTGQGRSRSPGEMIVELPPGSSELGKPKTGDVRQTPKFVPIHEGHKPTMIDINRRASPPLSPPMAGTENTGAVGAPPSTLLRRVDANIHVAEAEVRRPVGIPKTVTAPHMGAGSTRTGYFGGLPGRSHSSGDGAGSRPDTPPQSRLPVLISPWRTKEGRRSSKESLPSHRRSPAWEKHTIVEHAKRMGSYQLMMRDDGTGRLSGFEK